MSTIDEQFDTVIQEPVATEPSRGKQIAKKAGVLIAVFALGGALGYGVTQQQVGDAQAQADKDVAAAQAQAEEDVAAAEELAETRALAAETAIKTREDAVAQRETDVAAKESAVAGREAAVTTTEQAIDASKIQPGTYLVPEELTAGRYRTVNEVSYCYMKQTKGSDIIDNLLEESGRPVFTVTNVPGSEFLIDSDCGPVQKI